MEHRGEPLKPCANDPVASREELCPSIPSGINDQEQEPRGYGHLDRFEKVNLGEKSWRLTDKNKDLIACLA